MNTMNVTLKQIQSSNQELSSTISTMNATLNQIQTSNQVLSSTMNTMNVTLNQIKQEFSSKFNAMDKNIKSSIDSNEHCIKIMTN